MDVTSAQHEHTPSAANWLVGTAVLGVAAGVLARVVRYLDGRPLWSDEATVAGMLLERNLASLWSPDPADPVTPVGFALAVEAAVWLFGEGERALRAVSFVAGILALPLFWQLATRCLGRRDAWLALGIFAVLEPLVFYSSELKQYATDVLIALSIAVPGAALIRERAAPGRALALAIAAGAVGVWISLPAAFVAGGLVGALVLRGLGGDGPSLRRAAWIAVLVGSSFVLCYATTIGPHQANQARVGWWEPFYPPLGLSLEALAWYPRTFFAFFHDPVGLPEAGLAAVLFLLGALRLAPRDPATLALLIGPIALAFVASLLQLVPFPTSTQYGLLEGYYPFFGRVLLFGVPGCVLVIAAGIGRVLDWRDGRSAWVGLVATAVLLAMPVYVLARNVIDPPVIQDGRSLIRGMEPLVEPGDRVLTLRYAAPVVDYYTRAAGLPRPSAVLQFEGQRDVAPLLARFSTLPAGERFWLVTVHHPHWPSRAERDAMLPLFARFADALEHIESERGNADLFRRR